MKKREFTSMISKKLKSNDGATLFFALLFFVLCAVAGSIVLSSASGVSGELASLNNNDTDYYSVSSASRYLADVLSESEFQITDIKEEVYAHTRDGLATQTNYIDGDLCQIKDDIQYSDTFMVSKLRTCFSEYLELEAENRWQSGVIFKYKGQSVVDHATYALTIDGLDAKDTDINFNIDNSGTISMVIKPEGGSYVLKLTAVANVSTVENTEYTDNDDGSRSFTTTRRSTITYPSSGITIQKITVG